VVDGRQREARFPVAAHPARAVSVIGWLLALSVGTAACSPATYARRARAVEQALGAATETSAETSAPYELVSARLYLEKAREEAGQAHYAMARQLLAVAEQNAVLARTLSLSRAGHARTARQASP
jgi:hypothetical protein